jgi:hypothetical protein
VDAMWYKDIGGGESVDAVMMRELQREHGIKRFTRELTCTSTIDHIYLPTYLPTNNALIQTTTYMSALSLLRHATQTTAYLV